MLFITIKTMLIVFAPYVVAFLGHVSDYMSDISPEFLKGFEHVVFTMLLN